MTAGTRRNGASKLGPFRRAAARGSAGPADTGAYAEESSWTFGEPQGFEEPQGLEELQGFEGPQGLAETQGFDEPRSKRYTGRHASPRGKAARKIRVGRVVPVAAVAATIAAGTAAAYGIGGGQSQPTHLNAAMSSLPGSLASARAATADSAASGLVKVATASGSSAAHAAAKPAAKATPSRKPAAPPTAAATHAAAPSTPATTQAAAPAATPSASSTHAASALSCNVNYGMLPDNVTAIVSFLLANGYSDNAASGIAGNIYQESKGNPESVGMGGGGLIGWTPLPSGFVTGNVTADLQTQLNALLTYNQGWSQYISTLNAAASPADAAYIYVTDFERAGIPAASTREAAATNVASACGI